jgi:carbamoyl-phosphate synthase large subunit
MGERWIGVTGFYTTDNPHPGLAVVRALRAADPSWRVMALAWDAWGTGAFARDLIDAVALVPYPGAGSAALRARLSAIVKRQPLDVVIPTIDAELPLYLAIQKDLRRLGVRVCLPSASALRAREKRMLPALGRRARVLVPRTVLLPSDSAVVRASKRLPYPQVVKGRLVDTVVTHGADDFRVAARQLAGLWGWPLLAQPVVPGEEYDVAVLARRGEVLGAAVMKKLGVTNKGTAWAGVTVEDPALVALTQKLTQALRWDGILEAEFMRAANGDAWCFEINPRTSSWIALAAEAGANLPAALVRMALGEPIDAMHAKPGMLFARALDEVIFHGNALTDLTDRNPGPHFGTGRVLALPALAIRTASSQSPA